MGKAAQVVPRIEVPVVAVVDQLLRRHLPFPGLVTDAAAVVDLRALAAQHRQLLQAQPLSGAQQAHWDQVAQQSLQAQAALEQASHPEDFVQLLARYRQTPGASG